MDVLIDLIIYLIKAAAKSREASVPRPLVQRQVSPTAQQIQAIQQTLAAQQARTKPAPGRARGPASWAQPGVRAAVPPVRQPPVPAITPSAAAIVPAPRPSAGIPGLKLPFLLGEVLSEPVSLRPEARGGLPD
jgi:hypothetical protein